MGNVESLITADKALMGGETNERNVDTKTQIETVKIGNGSVPVIEWRNQVVITTALLAQIYETDADNVKKNFSRHKDNFIEGTHYFLLQGEELCQFKNMVTNSPLVGKNANQLYLWTERGANRHCKILDTDKAWEQFDYLEEAYFNKDNLQKVPKDFAAALRLAADEYEKRMQLEQKNIELLADNQRMKPKAEFLTKTGGEKMRALQLEGLVFDRLEVLSESEPQISPSGHKTKMWKCRCACGNVVYVSTSHLTSGHTRSCGCLQKERTSEASIIDLSGRRFGRLKVISRISKMGEKALYECKCDCENRANVLGCNLVTGTTESCGCIRRENTGILSYKHGLRNERLYQTWCNMKSRCYNPNNKRYENYGGRGIRVCKEWKDNFKTFYDWAMANGYRDDLTIDRIDNDGNYEPKNCRWVTLSENSTKRNLEYWRNK